MKKLKVYMLRTLSYYQSEGGVYNDIITVLLKMRKLPEFRSMPVPARVLNESVYYWDLLREGKEYGDWTLTDEVDRKPLILSVLACLSAATLDEGWLFTQELKKKLESDALYYPHFASVVEKYEKNFEEVYLELHGESTDDIIKRQDESIKVLEEKLIEQSALVDRLREEIKLLDLELQKAKEGYYGDVSDLDRYLSLETILEWIKTRQHYIYTEHVFRMLIDMKDGRATDEEREKIIGLEMEMLNKNVSMNIINTNYAVGSNLMTGVAHSPLMPVGITPEDIIKQFLGQLNLSNNGQ